MKMLILFAFSYALLGKTEKISIEDALERNLITCSVESNGNGIKDGILTLQLKNNHKKPLNILIPAGAIFKSSDDPRQDQINVDQRVFVMQPNKSTNKKLITMCIEHNDMSPGEDIAYTYEKMADGNLLDCARYINSHELFNSSGQSAIWVFSDNDRPNNIYSGGDPKIKELQAFVAKKLGQEVPWYEVEYNEQGQLADDYVPQSGGYDIPTRVREMAKIHGRFEYQLLERGSLTFGIYDSTGAPIEMFFEDRSGPAGDYAFRFRFEANDVPPGTYYARMTNREEVIKEQEVYF